MKHDLGAINAALILGDPFIPPNGSICKCINSIGLRVTCEVRLLRFLGGEHYLRLDDTTDGLMCFVRLDCVREVIWIPEDSPPFGEWNRWKL
jgi:hypothetical protein